MKCLRSCIKKSLEILYLFPVAALRNYHKTLWLKQHKCIVLHFLSSKVLKQFPWASGRALSLWKLGGENVCCLSFLASRAALLTLFGLPCPSSKAAVLHLQISYAVFTSPSVSLTKSCRLIKDSYEYFRTTINPGWILLLKNLNLITLKVFVAIYVT